MEKWESFFLLNHCALLLLINKNIQIIVNNVGLWGQRFPLNSRFFLRETKETDVLNYDDKLPVTWFMANTKQIVSKLLRDATS